MQLRIHSNGDTYVKNHILKLSKIGTNTYSVPILSSQVDKSTIIMNKDMYIGNGTYSMVYKGPNTYSGYLISYSDNTVKIESGTKSIIIRDYDRIVDERSLVLQLMSNIQSVDIIMSYLTSGINGSMLYKLNYDTDVLTGKLYLVNNTISDIKDAKVVIVTSTNDVQAVPQTRMMAFEAEEDVSYSKSSTPVGTEYVLNGKYTVPHGYTGIFDVYEFNMESNSIYTIDAPNGRSSASLVIIGNSPADLAPGKIQVYMDDKLVSTKSFLSYGEGETYEIEVSNVPSVYAKGTKTSSSRPEPNTNITDVELNGVIYNMLDKNITVRLRSYIGNAKISSDDEYTIDNGYIYWDYDILTKDKVSYDHLYILEY